MPGTSALSDVDAEHAQDHQPPMSSTTSRSADLARASGSPSAVGLGGDADGRHQHPAGQDLRRLALRRPGLGRWKVTVTSARTTGSDGSPLVRSTAVGVSTARTGTQRARARAGEIHGGADGLPQGPADTVPSSASMTSAGALDAVEVERTSLPRSRGRVDAVDAVEPVPVQRARRRCRAAHRRTRSTTSEGCPPRPGAAPPRSRHRRCCRGRRGPARRRVRSSARPRPAAPAPRPHGHAGLLHEPVAGRAQALGPRIGAAHLLGGHGGRAACAAQCAARTSTSVPGAKSRSSVAGSGIRVEGSRRQARSRRDGSRMVRHGVTDGRRTAPSARSSSSPSRCRAAHGRRRCGPARGCPMASGSRPRRRLGVAQAGHDAAAQPARGGLEWHRRRAVRRRSSRRRGTAAAPARIRDAAPRPALAHQRRTRTGGAVRSPRPAERGPQLHRGVRPGGRVAARTSASATACSSRRRAAGRPRTPADDPAHVGVHRGHRLPEGEGRHRPRRVRPDAGQRLQGRDAVRAPGPPCSLTMRRAARCRLTRTAVVAQPRPGAQHVRRARPRPAPAASGSAP